MLTVTAILSDGAVIARGVRPKCRSSGRLMRGVAPKVHCREESGNIQCAERTETSKHYTLAAVWIRLIGYPNVVLILCERCRQP